MTTTIGNLTEIGTSEAVVANETVFETEVGNSTDGFSSRSADLETLLGALGIEIVATVSALPGSATEGHMAFVTAESPTTTTTSGPLYIFISGGWKSVR